MQKHLYPFAVMLLTEASPFNSPYHNTFYKVLLYKRIDQNNGTDRGDTGRHLDSLRRNTPRRLGNRVDIG